MATRQIPGAARLALRVPLDMRGERIFNIPDPDSDCDAVNLQYLNGIIANLPSADSDTTYRLELDSDQLTLVGSDGTRQTVTLPTGSTVTEGGRIVFQSWNSENPTLPTGLTWSSADRRLTITDSDFFIGANTQVYINGVHISMVTQ